MSPSSHSTSHNLQGENTASGSSSPMSVVSDHHDDPAPQLPSMTLPSASVSLDDVSLPDYESDDNSANPQHHSAQARPFAEFFRHYDTVESRSDTHYPSPASEYAAIIPPHDDVDTVLFIVTKRLESEEGSTSYAHGLDGVMEETIYDETEPTPPDSPIVPATTGHCTINSIYLADARPTRTSRQVNSPARPGIPDSEETLIGDQVPILAIAHNIMPNNLRGLLRALQVLIRRYLDRLGAGPHVSPYFLADSVLDTIQLSNFIDKANAICDLKEREVHGSTTVDAAYGGHGNRGHANGGHANGSRANEGHANGDHVNGRPVNGHVNGGPVNGGHYSGGYVNGGHANAGHAIGGHANGGHASGGHANRGHASGGHANRGRINGGHANDHLRGHVNGSPLNGGHVYGGLVYGGYVQSPYVHDGHIYGSYIHGGRIYHGYIQDAYVQDGYIWGDYLHCGHIYHGYVYGADVPNGYVYGSYVHGGQIYHGYVQGAYLHGVQFNGGPANGRGANGGCSHGNGQE